MSVSSLALPLLLALARLFGPPELPPDPGEASEDRAPAGEAAERTQPPALAPTTPRSPLPPGLEPVANPFQAEPPATPSADAEAPNADSAGAPSSDAQATSAAPQRNRAIVDLRDPFSRPPPRNARTPQRGERMILPDLKDPFAPGVRRVRSRQFSSGLRDIRDPFREGGHLENPRPPCSRKTDDGTVVQAPGSNPVPECAPASIDLRDPFQDR